MTVTITKFAILAGLGVMLLACDTGASRQGTTGWRGTIDTLESGRLVVRNPQEPARHADAEEPLQEVFRIGAFDGEGAEVFGEITDVEFGPDGELYVLDSQSAEIRVFGHDGRHLRTFGRAGQGPGEFSRAAGMAVDSEGLLWVLNWGNGRYSAFDPSSGRLVVERTRVAGFVSIPWSGEFDRSNRLLDMGLGRDGQPVALRLDTMFLPRDTIALPRADERHRVNFVRGELRVMSVMDPFAAQPAWAPDPNGGIVIGDGHAYRLHRVNARGDTVVTIEVPRAAVSVTREERDSALAAFQRTIEMAGGATPDRQPRVSSNKPAHGAIFVDDRGRIWVRQTPADDTTRWDVFDEDGRLTDQITISLRPGYVTPAVRGDRLAVVTVVDEVPTIVVFTLPGSE